MGRHPGGGAAIGPVASGFLLEHFWWGSVFLVNLVGAFGVARQLGAEGAALVEASKQAFVDGMGVAALTGAVVVVIAAILSYRLLPHGPGPTIDPEPGAPDSAPADEEFALAD